MPAKRFPGRAGAVRRFPVVGPLAVVAVALALVAGAGLYLRIEKRVTLLVEGSPRTVLTLGGTVGDVLERQGVPVTRETFVSPAVSADVVDGMTVAVEVLDFLRWRDLGVEPSSLDASPESSPVVERRRVPIPTEVRTSEDLERGESDVVSEGRPGLARVVYRVRLTPDGLVATVVDRVVLREPVPRVIVRGTAEPTSEEGIATWYEREGMVAAHPWLPLGTSVVVTNAATGERVTVIIDDRGPFGPGRIIDLSDDAFERLAPLSRGTLWVHIAW